MVDQTQETRLQLRTAGCPEDCFDRAVALSSKLETAGVNWLDLVKILSKLAQDAPLLLDLLEKLLAQKKPSTT